MKVVLILLSSSIMSLLGIIHLGYTYLGQKLSPSNPEIMELMKQSTLKITSETTMWKAWLGFNTTHSMAAIFFGLIYGHLAIFHPDILFESLYLKSVGLVMLLGFFILGWAYFFSVPFIGTSIALGSYIVGMFFIIYQ